MTGQPSRTFFVPPTLFGTTYPTEYVTAMFADPAAAQTSASELEAAGVEPEGIVVATGDQLLRNERAVRERRGLRDHIMSLFPSVEAQIVKQYIELAEQGYAAVAVYVPDSDLEQRNRVTETLRRNGGGYLHYYGKLTVTDL